MKSLPRILTVLFAAMLFLFVSATALAAPTTPTADFIDNMDGTVTHKITGLTWKRCAEGMTWSGSTCTGTAQTYTWADAVALTATFAGKSDWRLPTIAELATIVENNSISPAINATIFAATPSDWFWSASADAGGAARGASSSAMANSSPSISRSATMFVLYAADSYLVLWGFTRRAGILPTTPMAQPFTRKPT